MARTVVITQPTYLPWLGYFDLIDQSDLFVFLDNVQFSKQSWQQRNRIRTAKGLEWLTVPVRRKGRTHRLIREIEIGHSSSFPDHHLRAIELNYKRAPYFDQYFPKLCDLFNKQETLLYNLNIRLIRWFASEIGIDANFELSSTLGGQGKRSELLVDLCKRVEASVYLSPLGSAAYLTQDNDIFDQSHIKIFFQNYTHPEYKQVYKPFIPYASVLDLLFNRGNHSLDIIRSGRNDKLSLQAILDNTTNL